MSKYECAYYCAYIWASLTLFIINDLFKLSTIVQQSLYLLCCVKRDNVFNERVNVGIIFDKTRMSHTMKVTIATCLLFRLLILSFSLHGNINSIFLDFSHSFNSSYVVLEQPLGACVPSLFYTSKDRFSHRNFKPSLFLGNTFQRHQIPSVLNKLFNRAKCFLMRSQKKLQTDVLIFPPAIFEAIQLLAGKLKIHIILRT